MGERPTIGTGERWTVYACECRQWHDDESGTCLTCGSHIEAVPVVPATERDSLAERVRTARESLKAAHDLKERAPSQGDFEEYGFLEYIAYVDGALAALSTDDTREGNGG